MSSNIFILMVVVILKALGGRGVQSKVTYNGSNIFRVFFSNPSCNKQGVKTVLYRRRSSAALRNIAFSY